MAKGQMRSGREPKKPKADKKAVATPTTSNFQRPPTKSPPPSPPSSSKG